MKSNNDFKNILDKETISLAEKDRKDKDKGKNFFINKEYNAKTRFILIMIIIISISFNIFIFFKYKKSETNKLNKNLTNFKNKEINYFNKINLQINKPFLPIETEDIPIKSFYQTKYNKTNIRYHFDEIYSNRTLFEINYSYLPYTNIKKSISYDENANIIYNSTGMLNLTLLDFYYNNIDIDKTQFNHIHISMGFDANYVLLSSISIASLLNNSKFYVIVHMKI